MGYASYQWACWLFLRGLALTYCIAFLVALLQFPALQGERGLEPVSRRLGRQLFWSRPSLFHFYYSDRFLRLLAATGLAIAAGTAFGATEQAGIVVAMLCWLILWVLYQSINNIGGTFWGYGWESKLLDAGFLAIFMGPSWLHKPLVIVVLLRWLLLRIELGAGLIKMRGDPCWRRLDCMRYHHETQPIPNPLSRLFHFAPRWWHKLETAGNHAVQLGVIWLVFAPQPVASWAGAVIVFTQLWLLQSGNYSWLNFLTICVACSAFSDQFLQQVVGVSIPNSAVAPVWYDWSSWGLAALVAFLSIPVLKNLSSRQQRMNASYNPLHIVNTYGAFGSVSKERQELIIEGTRDSEPSELAKWLAYEMKAKPGDPRRRPRQVAPYHLRLDWQLWFVPLRPGWLPRWLLVFAQRLLENDPATLALIAENPFADAPPRYLRMSLYSYRYATAQERRLDGNYWVRSYLVEYLAPHDLAAIRRQLQR